MTISTKYARLLSFIKDYIFLLLLASSFLLAACSSGGENKPPASDSQSNLSIADATALESAGAIEFTVSLSATSDSATSFYYRTQDGSANATSDYISVTKKTASIAAGNNTTTIRVAIIDDKEVEDAESFVVEILDSSSNSLLDTATATIEDDDLPSLSIADATALEGAGSIKFTVSLSESFPGNIVSFDYATIAGSAIADLDYTSTSDTTSIQAGDTTAEIIIAIINDASVEDDETFELTISNPHNATIDENAASAIGTIKIDDLPRLSIADAAASEDAGSIKFTVSLSESFPGNIVSFDYATIAGSAIADLDYTSTSDTTSIQAGDTTAEIIIAIINDASVEDDETFELTISNPHNATIDENAASAIGTIKIDDLPRLSIADAAASEDAGSIKFTVSLSESFPGNIVSFDYATIAGSAIADLDYTSTSDTTSIQAGDTTAEIIIAIINDASVEDDETFELTISNPHNATIDENAASAIGTIKIDDLPRLSIADAAASEDAGSIKFTVSLSESFPGNIVSFDYATIAGSAIADLDYTSTSDTTSIQAGDTTAEIIIAIINDASVEDDETFELTISNPHNATIDENAASAIGTIKIDDLPRLSIADAAASEDAGSIKFTVSLSESFPDNIVSFDYATIAGSAIADLDYTSTSDTTSIQAGDTTAEIIIAIINDASVEDIETFDLEISNPINATIDKNRARATATIENDDLPSLSIADATALEGAGSIKFTVSLSESFPGNIVSFDYATIAGSAIADLDYTSTSDTTSIQAGDTTAEIIIAIINDASVEDDETFELTISNPHNATIDENAASAIGTIKIDDLPRLSIADAAASEDAGSIKFTVSLSESFPGNIVSFDYATIAGSAIADLDYTSTSDTTSIQAGDTTAEIIIAIINDASVEDDETFELTISNPHNATIDENAASAIGTIKIDDLPRLSIADAAASEDAGSIKFTVSLSESFPGNIVSFDYATIAGSAIADLDYTSTSDTTSIQAGDTTAEIIIAIINDASVEDDETFELTISNPHNATIDENAASAIGTIKIDDLPRLSIADAAASEDAGSIKFTVSLSESFPGNIVSFDYATIAGSAIADLDYTSTSDTTSIQAGDTTAEIIIAIINDASVEDDETFELTISNPHNATIDENAASAIGTIKIDDLPRLSIADAAASEDAGSIKFTVSLSESFPGNIVSFDYATIAGSAIADLDYTSTSDTTSIQAGDITAEIIIAIINDASVEDDETFELTISNPHNATIDENAASAIGTIKIDDLPRLSIADAAASEDAGSIKFTVSLSESFPDNIVSFDYATIAGSAIADLDYTSTSDTTSIQAGDTTAEIFIKIIKDTNNAESDEFFEVSISNPVNATINRRLASARGVITGEIPSLSIRGGSVDESTNNITNNIKFVVSLSKTTDKDVSFDYQTIATGSASADLDYTSMNARATISSGSTTTDILIGILADTSIEDAETFLVEISNPINATIDISQATGTIKINGLSLSIADATTLEDAGSIKFRVSLSALFPGNKDVVFNYETRETTNPRVANAIAGTDYTNVVAGRATIDSGELATSIMIDINDDNLVEDIETFLVEISPNQLDIPIIKPQATGTIKIDELPSLSIANSSAKENAGVLTFKARLSEPFPGNLVSFDYQTQSGSANNKIVWQKATEQADWSARERHSSVVFNGKIWVLGGDDGSRQNDVYYSSDGSNWNTATTDAAWSARHSHTSVVFNGKIWVLGGNDGNRQNDVYYSSDGSNWNTATTDAAWSDRAGHSSVVFKKKMWVMGGSKKNDVYYSSDGSNWNTATTDAAWSRRSNHSSVVFDNKIWLLGGNESKGANNNPPGGRKNDVWYSTDGINWNTATTDAAWTTRHRHSSVVFDGKIWVLGGINNRRNNNVWYSSNGKNWTKSTENAAWSERYSHRSVVFGDKIWVLGGSGVDDNSTNDVYFADATGDYFSASGSGFITGGERSTTINITLLDDDILEPADETFDIIISNPVNATIDTAAGDNQATGTIADIAIWTEVVAIANTTKSEHTSVVTRYNGENLMWVIGGIKNSATSTTHYSADGINWTEKSGSFFARKGHSSVVHSFDSENYIFILGGKNSDGIKNQIYRSQQNPTGIGWTLMNNLSNEERRYAHSSVVFDGKIWMLGGKAGNGNENTVYSGSLTSSTNLDFTKVKANNNTGWSARSEHTSVVFNDKIWVLGGNDGSNKNDVWSSTDGGTWTMDTEHAAWSARSEHTSVVFDGKIWVLGGKTNNGRKNDVWYSTDGKNWGKVTTTSTTWSARRQHTSVVFKDKIWVLGGNDGSNKKDVWHLSE